MKKWGLLVGLFVVGLVQASDVDIRYVNTDSLNVRSAPSGSVVGTLPRSAAVVVHQQSGNWAMVSDERHSRRWVSADLLCTGARCWERSGSGYTVTPQRQSYTAPARQSYSPTSGCPCSGSRNCTGPRGGRYCITSGGNKRYR